jgi:hypothetical protein
MHYKNKSIAHVLNVILLCWVFKASIHPTRARVCLAVTMHCHVCCQLFLQSVLLSTHDCRFLGHVSGRITRSLAQQCSVVNFSGSCPSLRSLLSQQYKDFNVQGNGGKHSKRLLLQNKVSKCSGKYGRHTNWLPAQNKCTNAEGSGSHNFFKRFSLQFKNCTFEGKCGSFCKYRPNKSSMRVGSMSLSHCVSMFATAFIF